MITEPVAPYTHARRLRLAMCKAPTAAHIPTAHSSSSTAPVVPNHDAIPLISTPVCSNQWQQNRMGCDYRPTYTATGDRRQDLAGQNPPETRQYRGPGMAGWSANVLGMAS